MPNVGSKIDLNFYEELEDRETEYDVYHNKEKLSSNRNEKVKEDVVDRKNARGRAWIDAEQG